MITIPLTPAQFAASKLKVEAELGSQLPGDKGTIAHEGVQLAYSYDGTMLTVQIVHKPFLLSQSLVESKINGWFKG